MSKKPDEKRIDGAADRLNQAHREATFSAKVGLTRATGKKANELPPGQVKAVAEPIYQAAAAEMIAKGALDLPPPSGRKSHTAREEARRRPPRRGGASENSHAGHELKVSLHRHGEALEALAGEKPLTAEHRAGVRAFFEAHHPRTRDKAVQKARGDAELGLGDRAALTKIIDADRRKAQAARTHRSQPKDARQGELDLGRPKRSHRRAERDRLNAVESSKSKS